MHPLVCPWHVGLAIHVSNSLFIGFGDRATNALLCLHGRDMMAAAEPPAAIRQYDGAF